MKKSTCKIISTIAVAGIGLTLCSVIGYKLGYRKAFERDCAIYKQMRENDPELPNKLTTITKDIDFSKI